MIKRSSTEITSLYQVSWGHTKNHYIADHCEVCVMVIGDPAQLCKTKTKHTVNAFLKLTYNMQDLTSCQLNVQPICCFLQAHFVTLLLLLHKSTTSDALRKTSHTCHLKLGYLYCSNVGGQCRNNMHVHFEFKSFLKLQHGDPLGFWWLNSSIKDSSVTYNSSPEVIICNQLMPILPPFDSSSFQEEIQFFLFFSVN